MAVTLSEQNPAVRDFVEFPQKSLPLRPQTLQGRVRIPIGGDSPRAGRQEPLELRHRQCSRGSFAAAGAVMLRKKCRQNRTRSVWMEEETSLSPFLGEAVQRPDVCRLRPSDPFRSRRQAEPVPHSGIPPARRRTFLERLSRARTPFGESPGAECLSPRRQPSGHLIYRTREGRLLP